MTQDLLMAKDNDEGTGRRKPGKAQAIAVWTLLSMLILGLGGFGVTNFSGTIRSIGSVGDVDLSIDDYARAFRNEVQATSAQFGQQLTMEAARAFGLDRRALGTLISEAAIDNEAQRIGLSVGDARLADQLASLPEFQGESGFDRARYDFFLERINQTSADFEGGLRKDLGRSIFIGAVGGGTVPAKGFVEPLYAWVGERRSVQLLRLSEADLTAPLAEPSEADLTAWHKDNIATYTRPEAKRIRYLALLPAEMAAEMTVADTDVEALYQSRLDEFVVPEKRLVERLVYPDDAAATAAKARLDAGTTFEDLVADRGLSLDDIDLNDVTRDDLGAAADAVFGLGEPGVVGPIATDLGPALFRMNAILPAQETTLDEARPFLTEELQIEAARDAIADRVEEFDDLLAGGATLEDIAKEKALDLRSIDFAPGFDTDEVIAGYAEFQQAANDAVLDETTDIIVLEDGGLMSLRLEEILPPAPLSLDDVRDRVDADWRTDQRSKALAARAAEIRTAVEAGASLGGFGVTEVTPALSREGSIAAAPADLVTTLFALAEGAVTTVETPEFVAVAKVTAITPAEAEGPEAEAMKSAIGTQLEQAVASDIVNAFTGALSDQAGVRLDQSAIDNVLTQLQ